jgi:hypothetical protein
MHPEEGQFYIYREYFLGIDLGQRADHSAVAVVEEAVWVEGDWGLELNISGGTGEERRLLTGWVSPDVMTHHQLLTAKRLNLTRGRPPNSLAGDAHRCWSGAMRISGNTPSRHFGE